MTVAVITFGGAFGTVPKGFEKRLAGELEIRRRIQIIQIIVLLKLVRIL